MGFNLSCKLSYGTVYYKEVTVITQRSGLRAIQLWKFKCLHKFILLEGVISYPDYNPCSVFVTLDASPWVHGAIALYCENSQGLLT